MFGTKSTTAVAATAAVLAASLVSATPVRRQTEALSPCANITQLYEQFAAGNESGTFQVDGQLANDCLDSMSFDPERGSAYVQAITNYIQFQSTIPFLLNPPKTYLSPAVDLLGGLEAIFQKANTSQYTSQYQLDTDLNNLVESANDGHLDIRTCSLSVFQFSVEYDLVSVSEDGLQLPKIYLFPDAVLLMQDNTSDVSDIVMINGQNATQYVEAIGLTQMNQDPDAQYNDVFHSLAKLASFGPGSQLGAFALPVNWPGTPSIELTFSNGSTASSQVTASLGGALTGFNFTDGQSLFEAVCLPAPTNTTSNGTGTSASDGTQTTPSILPTETAGPLGYGIPVIRDPYNKIIGYYIDDADYNDTAVLFVPNFEPSGDGLPDSEYSTFSFVASQFVNQSISDGKTKMIIDVSGNPGGDIAAGFDLFRLFFPDISEYTATRMRDHPAEELIMKAFSVLDPNSDVRDAASPFYYGNQVTPDQNSSFQTWEDLYGPDDIQGANMTALYANFNFTSESINQDPIRGYGGVPLNVSSRPFEAENILVVSDGFCQSTCTTFVNLMTNPQFGAGVKSVAFGGRPINEPMQIIGGVRGGQSMDWSTLSSYSGHAYLIAQNTTNTTTPVWSADEFELANNVLPIPLEYFPLQFISGNLNLRNAYNPDDSDTPLQFTYQAADCKLFYTPENIVYPNTTWPAAAKAMWGNGGCVPGSTNVTASTNSTM